MMLSNDVKRAAGLRRAVVALLLTCFLTMAGQLLLPAHATAQVGQSYHLLIKFTAGSSQANRDAAIAQVSGHLVRWLAPLNTALVRVRHPGGQRFDKAIVSALQANPDVVSVEYDRDVSGVPAVMDPPQISERVAQNVLASGSVWINDPDFNNPQRVYAPQLIGLADAWIYTMGEPGVVVAVLDSGVNAEHPDLRGRILSGYDFANDDSDAGDDYGHGTHIAGIIAASGNNGLGSAGICPLCSILPVKVLDADNVGTWSSVAAGIVYAVENGADIINLSLGSNDKTQVIQDAIAYAVEEGIVVVAAAGNGSSDTPFYPAALDTVLAVAATQPDDRIWPLSNYGDWIDVAAPGDTIYSTYHDLENVYGGYLFMSGTSMAAPHVAGLAGLLLSQQTERTPVELRRLIVENAADLGAMGKDTSFGYGRIHARRALLAGRPESKSDAVLAGSIWQDDDADGLWGPHEKPVAISLTVRVWSEQGDLIGVSSVDGTGAWRVENLGAGHYRIDTEIGAAIQLTSRSEYNLDVAEGQVIDELHFGVIPLEAGIERRFLFMPWMASP